jgi:hypothetical protein
MTDLRVHDDRSARSRWSDLRVHDGPKFAIVYGFTAGAFVPVGRMALGGILSFAGHSFSGFHCSNSSGWVCSSRPIDTKLISFSVAMML